MAREAHISVCSRGQSRAGFLWQGENAVVSPQARLLAGRRGVVAGEGGGLCTETHRNLFMESLWPPETPGSSQFPWK